MAENVNLNDLMGNTGRSTTVFDMTSGKGAVQASGDATEQVKRPTMQAVPVQSGPIDMSSIKPIDVNSILPKRAPKVNPIEASMMADLDAAVDRECDKITELHQQIFAKQDEERQAAEERAEDERQAAEDQFALTGVQPEEKDDYDEGLYEDDEVSDSITIRPPVNRFSMVDEGTNNTIASTPVSAIEDGPITINNMTHVATTKNKNAEEVDATLSAPFNDATIKSEDNKPVNILDTINDEDLFDDEDEDTAITKSEDPEPSAEELLDDLKAQIKTRISPVRNGLDLTKFTIARKAISAQKVMKLAVHSHQNVADWVLPSAKRSISMTGLSGPEILKLNPENSNRNRQNTFRDMYRIIYDHVLDGNKPEFEVWLKQTRFVDLQHIYFALYMATFGGSNFINYSCPKCKKVFIQDIDFKDMVTYADDETKAKIQAMLKMDTTSKSADSYEAQMIQVSDSYVFAIRTPSIWNVIMETASLSDPFLQKHADLIDMVAYIDAAYIIDHSNMQLIPVDTKPDANDMAKTAARRIKAMYDIISTLSSEEFYALRNTLNEYDEFANNSISYKIPACTCKHCGTEIPANTEITPDAILFTRHQLAAIGNM